MRIKQRFLKLTYVLMMSLLTWIQSNLEFELRVQEYIELVRTGQHLPAIAYYRKYLVPFAQTHREAIQRAAGLLAFPPDTKVYPYKVRYIFFLSLIIRTCMRKKAGKNLLVPSFSLITPCTMYPLPRFFTSLFLPVSLLSKLPHATPTSLAHQ